MLLAGCELVVTSDSEKDYRVDGGDRFDAGGGCPTRCDGVCVDPERSRDHCGECGVSCMVGELCEGGRCTPEPVECGDESLTQCGTECADLASSLAHCGECFAGCSHDCFDGMCEGDPCPAGEIGCEMAEGCIDPMTDAAHCGGCDQACASDEVCVDGVCDTSPCGAGETPCGTECVDTDANALHCGGCGLTCDPGFRCQTGSCTCTYSLFCEGYCGSERSQVHCGRACGNECGPNDTCQIVRDTCRTFDADGVYQLWPDVQWGALSEVTHETHVCSDTITAQVADLACYRSVTGRVGRVIPASFGALGPPPGSPVDISCPTSAVNLEDCTYTPSASCSGRELLIFCELP